MPAIAYMTIDFLFPNMSVASLDKNLMAMLAISIVVGMPSGYLIRRSDLAMVTVIAYVSIGYVLALVYYSMPYTIYDVELVLPSFYYMLFFRFTVILLFIFVLGGFMGAVFGQIMRDSVSREATSLTWSQKK
jgi:hypothetical protein